MSCHEHKDKAEQLRLSIAVVTISDSRTEETDVNGQFLKSEILKLGHRLRAYKIIKDDAGMIGGLLELLADDDVDVMVFNGGTGISGRDTTFDVLIKKLDKVLDGFGEMFRMLSYQEIGSAAMLSRAVAGVYKNKIVFSTPGSSNAVKLAWDKLIAPEMKHLVSEVRR